MNDLPFEIQGKSQEFLLPEDLKEIAKKYFLMYNIFVYLNNKNSRN